MTTHLYKYLVLPTILTSSLGIGVVGYADPPSEDKTLIVDGISVLSGNRTSNESDATPLLLSDIEFESVLILVSRLGPAGVNHRPTDEDWLRARRRATMIRLLAGQARNLHEVADPEVKEQLLKLVSYDLGGQEAINRLLTRLGMKRSALENWVENAALALNQIRYLRDQVELPSRRDVDARILSEKEEFPDAPSVREEYRFLLRKEKTTEQIEKWLNEIIQKGHIRIIR